MECKCIKKCKASKLKKETTNLSLIQSQNSKRKEIVHGSEGFYLEISDEQRERIMNLLIDWILSERDLISKDTSRRPAKTLLHWRLG